MHTWLLLSISSSIIASLPSTVQDDGAVISPFTSQCSLCVYALDGFKSLGEVLLCRENNASADAMSVQTNKAIR